MAFVKLDCGTLDSTLWIDRSAREIFITALLMAEPYEALEPVPQIAVRTLDHTGFEVPAGWYGIVHAAGPGIVRRALVDAEEGMAALERLGSEDQGSRSQEFGGRRLIRINGGYLVLNFDKYRQKDHTAAERMARWRDRKKDALRVTVTPSRVTSRSVTQAEAEAEAEAEKNTQTDLKVREPRIPNYEAWLAYAMEKHPSWPVADIRRAWEYYESIGWKKGKTPIVKWKLCVSTCFQNHAKFDGGRRPAQQELIPGDPGYVASLPSNVRAAIAARNNSNQPTLL